MKIFRLLAILTLLELAAAVALVCCGVVKV
jgi:hypothetical protein